MVALLTPVLCFFHLYWSHIWEHTHAKLREIKDNQSTLHFLYVLSMHALAVPCNHAQLQASLLVSIQVYDSGALPVVGERYSLTCNVSTMVARYHWRQNGRIIPEETQETLMLPSLTLSDAGNYACEVTLNSRNYSANNISVMLESRFVLIDHYHCNISLSFSLVPAPLSVVVISNIPNSIRPIGANVSLTCTVELSPAVDVQVTVSTEWRGPAGFYDTNMAQPDTDNTSYSSMVIISSFENINSGDYTCIAEVVVSFSQYLNNSRATSNEARITTGKSNITSSNKTV